MSCVAVRPPEYFPRLAYCALFFRVDHFVLADTFPYSRQSFQNRVRVRTPEQDGRQAHWMTVPLRAGRSGRPIREMQVAERGRWADRHRKALAYNYSTAPYYAHYAPGLHALLEQEWNTLSDLTSATVVWTHGALRVPCTLALASHLPDAPDVVMEVLQAVGARTLITLPESEAADRAAAHAADADLDVLAYDEQPRRQNFDGFEPGLSALDLLMNYGPEAAGVLTAGLG